MPANPPRAPGELADELEDAFAQVRDIEDTIGLDDDALDRALDSFAHLCLGLMPDVIASLRSANSDGGEAMGWQPIETAPKDGTTIILGFYEIDAAGERDWFTPEGNFVDGYMPAGWYEHEYVTQVQPTHWVPKLTLPPPPAPVTEARRAETLGSACEGTIGEAEAPKTESFFCRWERVIKREEADLQPRFTKIEGAGDNA